MNLPQIKNPTKFVRVQCQDHSPSPSCPVVNAGRADPLQRGQPCGALPACWSCPEVLMPHAQASTPPGRSAWPAHSPSLLFSWPSILHVPLKMRAQTGNSKGCKKHNIAGLFLSLVTTSCWSISIHLVTIFSTNTLLLSRCQGLSWSFRFPKTSMVCLLNPGLSLVLTYLDFNPQLYFLASV